jgi:hypothetical protein
MAKRALLRAGLLVFFVYQAAFGIWALFYPRGFYDEFPAPGHPWVALLPPFNEHLIRDVGGLSLAFAFIFGASAITMRDSLVRSALIGYEFFAVPHFVFHAFHLHGFPVVDAIGQTVALAIVVVVPLALIGLTFGRSARSSMP